MLERLKWASGQAGQHSQPGSPGELRRLHSEIGKSTPVLLSTLRIALVGFGALAAAVGLCLRGGDWRVWVAAAATAGLGGFGLPMHWDSLRMLLWVMCTAAAVGGLLAFLPVQWRLSLLTLAVLFHFGGILTATTWPDTRGQIAWVPNQTGTRIYQPYFKFMYLSNAYHFYSPDPGPASKFCVLIEYEVEDSDEPNGKRTAAEWVELPKRRVNYRDPLGLTYYRRLSITELASYSTPGTQLPPSWEKAAIMQRRTQNEFDKSGKQKAVPGATSFNEIDMSQYRQPLAPTRRAVYPSYARHIAAEYSRPRTEARTDASGKTVEKVFNYKVTGIKMFRVEHRIIEAPQFLEYQNAELLRYRERNPGADRSTPTKMGGLSPYHPGAYSPYYLGEYAPDGTLKNPNDPLLYWLTPVQYLPNAAKDEKNFKDWMSEYAGREFPWEGKE